MTEIVTYAVWTLQDLIVQKSPHLLLEWSVKFSCFSHRSLWNLAIPHGSVYNFLHCYLLHRASFVMSSGFWPPVQVASPQASVASSFPQAYLQWNSCVQPRSWPCFEQSVGLGDAQRSFSTCSIGFCNITHMVSGYCKIGRKLLHATFTEVRSNLFWFHVVLKTDSNSKYNSGHCFFFAKNEKTVLFWQ